MTVAQVVAETEKAAGQMATRSGTYSLNTQGGKGSRDAGESDQRRSECRVAETYTNGEQIRRNDKWGNGAAVEGLDISISREKSL